MQRQRGFTLIELLVVIGIIAILSSLLLSVLAKAKMRARMVEEMSAGRQLMLAVQMYGNEHEDAAFPGYAADVSAVDDQNSPLFFPENARYPWRIAPYLGGSMSLIYSGVNRAKLNELLAGDHTSYVYSASLFPSLGINSYFLGGNTTEFPAATANKKFGDGIVITKLIQTKHPSNLIGFISARSDVTGNNAQGYYEVTPPYTNTRQWAQSYSDSLTADLWGFVSLRFNQRAVAALLDGHVETYTLDQTQDMTHWCDLATKPDWVLGN